MSLWRRCSPLPKNLHSRCTRATRVRLILWGQELSFPLDEDHTSSTIRYTSRELPLSSILKFKKLLPRRGSIICAVVPTNWLHKHLKQSPQRRESRAHIDTQHMLIREASC